MTLEDNRKELENIYKRVWNLAELKEEFTIIGFGGGMVVVQRISDGVKGAMDFQHMPRYYFDFFPS